MHCHQDILASHFEAPPAVLRRWQRNIIHLRQVPNLDQVGALLRPEWLTAFLLEPHDVRPGLAATMPRLALDPQQAEDIVAYLVQHASARIEPQAPNGNRERGRKSFASKGCNACHAFERPATWQQRGQAPPQGAALAPDLSLLSARFQPEYVVPWLLGPKAIAPDTSMPQHGLTMREAKDIAAYLLTTSPAPRQAPVVPKRLPLLQRRVTHQEVSERVLRKVCWHCHSQPDFARGDGGPGMSGGFGFEGRDLDLSSLSSLTRGYRDQQGKTASLFRLTPDGTPMLAAVLWARHREQAGEFGPLRGMPLGLPALPPEDIQLVESWIAQGRPE